MANFPLEIMLKQSNFNTSSTRTLYILCSRNPLKYHGPVQLAGALTVNIPWWQVRKIRHPHHKAECKNNRMAGRSGFSYGVEVGLNQPVFTTVDLE